MHWIPIRHLLDVKREKQLGLANKSLGCSHTEFPKNLSYIYMSDS